MSSRVLGAAALAFLVACTSQPQPAAAQQQPQAAQQTPAFQTGSLDQMLAPIALYPDTLLAQILVSAATPDKVVELAGWLEANKHLKGTAMQNAAVKAGYEPSFVALSLFPTVIAKMAQQLEWTTMLGQAFEANRQAVFDAIQKLRHQAEAVGTLKDSPQQDVTTRTTSGGTEVIVIEPANPQVIYVPQYNPEVVYTQAPAVAPTTVTQTVIVEDDDDDAAEAAAAGLIGFTAGIAIGAAMDNDYYYGPYGWHGGAYMYNDAWNDYYDHREDAREDWMDNREDMMEERTDRRENTQEQRTDRQENRQENRPEATQAQREQAQQAREQRAASGQTGTQRAQTAQSTGRTGSTQARGYGDGASTQRAQQRSGGSDAFSGYSSGSSQRASSTRGQQSRSSSAARGGGRSGGGGRRR